MSDSVFEIDITPQPNPRTVSEHIRARLLGTVEAREEWSEVFEQLMRNRLVMGRFRYGRLHDQTRTDRYNHVDELIRRAKLYQQDGNQEHLVDVANMALLEFVRGGSHPAPHWSPSDDMRHTPRLEGGNE